MKNPDVVAKEILAKLAVTAPGFSLELGTPERKIVDAVAESISEAYIDQYLVGSLMDLESKSGLELEQWVGIFGFGRLQGRAATGVIRIELNNTSPQDVTVQASSPFYTRQSLPSTGNPLYFQATQAVIIPAGSTVADVPVECTVVGSAGNVPPDSIVYIGDILGATSVTNLQAFTGGVNVETDDELRQRFKDTFLRNVAGTEDFYLGLCYQNKFVSKAACFGPVRKYATQIEAADEVNLASYITQDVKYAWPGSGHVYVFKNLGQAEETFYQINQDFQWLGGTSPTFTWLSDGDIAEGDIVDLEFEYTTRSSRNDPIRGIANKVDLFVNGTDPYVVTERALIDNAVRITNTETDQLYRNNFTRVGAAQFQAEWDLTNAQNPTVSITGGNPRTITLTQTPTGGTFQVVVNGEPTIDIPYNASAAVVQSALTALAAVGAGNVAVANAVDGNGTLIPGSFVATFGEEVEITSVTGTSNMTNAVASKVLIENTTVTITNDPTGGTYTLTYGGNTTSELSYDTSVSTLQTTLTTLVGSPVTVTGTPSNYVITLSAETKIPTTNNRFTRLGSVPVVSFPSILVVNGSTYIRGVHYHLLQLAAENQDSPTDTALMAGSIFEVVGIEWESTGPTPSSPATVVPVTMTYTHNRVPEVLQAMVKSNKQITTDVLVHQASYVYIRVYLSIEYDRGFVISQVDNAIQERLRAYFAGMPFGAWVEISDLALSVHQVLGVDNVNLVLEGDPGVGDNHGIKTYSNSEDSTPLSTYDTDFKLTDSQLPIFLDAVIRRRANK